MSSIMRARNGLTAEVKYRRSSGLSPELKVAGPSMLGIGCPDSHALPHITSAKTRRPRHALPPASGFVHRCILAVPMCRGRMAGHHPLRPISARHRMDRPRPDAVIQLRDVIINGGGQKFPVLRWTRASD